MTSDEPLLRIVRGDPDAAELAALVAVVSALTAQSAGPATTRGSTWADPARRLRPPPAAGRGAWRASGLPR